MWRVGEGVRGRRRCEVRVRVRVRVKGEGEGGGTDGRMQPMQGAQLGWRGWTGLGSARLSLTWLGFSFGRGKDEKKKKDRPTSPTRA